MIFHSLEIKSVLENTKNAVLVEFDVPKALIENYTFTAGQSITLDFTIERNHYRRTYSICSPPHESKLSISVKRQAKGIISNYINDAFFKGFHVRVSEPFGNFFNDAQIENTSTIMLWAGGSGITPLMSIAKHILFSYTSKKVVLVFANTNESSVMFAKEIDSLKNQFANGFQDVQILSNNIETHFVKKFFNKNTWQGLEGYIDADFISKIINQNPTSVHYICGPEKMMTLCEMQLSKAKDCKVYAEKFAGTTTINSGNKNAKLKVNINKKMHAISLQENNLLDAMLAQNLNPPYACKMGTCGACKATLLSGEVVSARDFALNEADKEANKILCCQAWAKSEEVIIAY
jgi:ring-1,2-phenylacetyl-CoA epoxidase subunit PaaE